MIMALTSAPLPIYKISATGNDFLLVDLLSPLSAAQFKGDRAQWARQWCDRHEGIGADGFVVLEPAPPASSIPPLPPLDFKWDFYNSDGGSAEMCGNAARAVSLYFKNTYGPTELTFATRAGEVRAQVTSEREIDVRLPAIASSQWKLKATLSPLEFDFVRVGVPHAVCPVIDISDRGNLRTIAGRLKQEPRFLHEGINVTFVQTGGSVDQITSVTFERGVEDFTLSCGTGAIAAAYSRLRGEENRRLEVEVPGGQLSVVWKEGCPHLIGPAKILAAIYAIRPT